MQVPLPEKKYPDAARRTAFFDQVLERLGRLPGVESAGVIRRLPLGGWPDTSTFSVAGRPNQPQAGNLTDFDFCTPDYFRTVGIPLLRGRTFDSRDKPGAPGVVIINEALAREHFPDEDPLGKRIHMEVFTGKIDDGWEIVGVVGNVRQRGLGDDLKPCVYRPQPFSLFSGEHLVIRSSVPLLSLADTVRKLVLEVDPAQPVVGVRSLEEVVGASIAQRRFILMLLSGFAGSALLLAAIGLYGVVAYAVSQRTHEIGIRVALGATRADVLGLILSGGMRLAGIGVLVGVAGAFGLTRLMTGLLYEVKPVDLPTFACVSLVLLLVTFFASWLPARRATRVDPMVALRSE
jgi:putative ABC transport system permease protein